MSPKRLVPALLALNLALPGSAAANTPSSGQAADVLRKVQQSSVSRSHPEEFLSFANTMTSAEAMLQKGDHAAASQLFSLAVLKGEILLDQARTAEETEPEQTGVFRQTGNAGKEPPPPPPMAPQPVREAEDPYAGWTGAASLISSRIVGGKGIYVVKRKESLKVTASRLGVRLRDLASLNGLKINAVVQPGQRLRYNNRRIVPKTIRNGIVVNIPDRNLYLFRNGRLSANYPVALGISKKGESTLWRTPTGRFRIVDKKENPTWRIPISIQKEMEENGEAVIGTVPPGPRNPLGRYALRTTLSGILIHSTTRPSSINSYSSHGCIRVMPEHMEKLFRSVKVPAEGEIIYQPVKVAVTGDGKVFLEVNRDQYEKVTDIPAVVKRMLREHKAADLVSWQKVNRVINEKTGIAEDVTLQQMPD